MKLKEIIEKFKYLEGSVEDCDILCGGKKDGFLLYPGYLLRKYIESRNFLNQLSAAVYFLAPLLPVFGCTDRHSDPLLISFFFFVGAVVYVMIAGFEKKRYERYERKNQKCCEKKIKALRKKVEKTLPGVDIRGDFIALKTAFARAEVRINEFSSDLPEKAVRNILIEEVNRVLKKLDEERKKEPAEIDEIAGKDVKLVIQTFREE